MPPKVQNVKKETAPYNTGIKLGQRSRNSGPNAVNDNRRAAANDNSPRSQRQVIQNARKVAKAPAKIAAAVTSVTMVFESTLPIYVIQILFGVLSLVSLGGGAILDETWLGSAADTVTFGSLSDAAIALMLIGMIVTLLCGCFSLVTAFVIMKARGMHPFHGKGILFLAMAFSFYLIPLFNLVPWAIFWPVFTAKEELD